MPAVRPLRPCNRPGCPELTRGRYCERHEQQQAERLREADRERGSAAQRGYDRRWREARIQFLRENPLCVECLAGGRVTPATRVDHITPHRGNKRLFWDRSNWQPLCAAHHNAKTAREDGGFGNPVRER